jgi:hypothetical protein
VRRESERCFEGELFDGVEADAVGDEQGKLEKGGARKDGCAEDGVVGEPGVLCERESSCEEEAIAVGEGDGGAEQRVIGRGQACGGDVGGVCLGCVEPEALALEGVGGE